MYFFCRLPACTNPNAVHHQQRRALCERVSKHSSVMHALFLWVVCARIPGSVVGPCRPSCMRVCTHFGGCAGLLPTIHLSLSHTHTLSLRTCVCVCVCGTHRERCGCGAAGGRVRAGRKRPRQRRHGKPPIRRPRPCTGIRSLHRPLSDPPPRRPLPPVLPREERDRHRR
jgi:hypothetical protein